MDAESNFNLVASINSLNCFRLVALAIGAHDAGVMDQPGQCHARGRGAILLCDLVEGFKYPKPSCVKIFFNHVAAGAFCHIGFGPILAC